MDTWLTPELTPNLTDGAKVQSSGAGRWLLEIPVGPGGRYRLAQVDDYKGLPRHSFRWSPPLVLSLSARASSERIPGTWGFGLWNDPFGMGIIKGSRLLRLPTLPNAAWFFFASPPNYLSLRDDLPARGKLASVFRSTRLPATLLALGALALPFLLSKPAVRRLRRLARRFVQEESLELDISVLDWHDYELDWTTNWVRFRVDGEDVLKVDITPSSPLGLVIWVDNQYAALSPDGRVRYGTLENTQAAWIEIRDLTVSGSPPEGRPAASQKNGGA